VDSHIGLLDHSEEPEAEEEFPVGKVTVDDQQKTLHRKREGYVYDPYYVLYYKEKLSRTLRSSLKDLRPPKK